MKKITALILFLYFISCDKIEPPYTENIDTGSTRAVLIEKFTGHKCSNCPDATRKMDELKEVYGDNLISVDIHPGNLAEFTATDDNYPYDFTTSSGDIISYDMGTSFLPAGTVNRIPGGLLDSRCWMKDDWATQINNLLYNENGDPLDQNIEIQIETSLNLISELTISTSINIINDFPVDYSLCVLITEDSIISPQLDGADYIDDYVHNHVYRCAVNGTSGENINDFLFVGLEGQFMYNSTHTITFDTNSNINWTNDWDNIENCHVIAYVYNSKTLIIEHTSKKSLVNE